MPRRLSDIITTPEDGALPLTLQYMRCARAQGISYGILVDYMPEHVRAKGYGQVILREIVPVCEQIKAGLQSYQWSRGMDRSLDAFLDVANDATWESDWTLRRIESAYLALFFAADCLVGDVLAKADYFTRRMPQWCTLRGIMSRLINGPLAYKHDEAERGYRLYERIREVTG